MATPPRDYAAAIARLKTRDERRAALDQVPPEWQPLVRQHVTNTLLLAKHWRERIAENPREPVPPGVAELLKGLE